MDPVHATTVGSATGLSWLRPRDRGVVVEYLSAVRAMVNGQPLELGDGSTVAGLVAQLGHDPARVAVERNEEVVTRRTWGETVICEGDEIEIVTFVGGG